MRFRALSLLSLLLVHHQSRADDVWNFRDWNWFTSRGYSFPFASGAYDGVNLAMNSYSCSGEYQKDWEIYDVSLGNILATQTMEVLKNFDLVLKHANTPNPVFTRNSWYEPIGKLQSPVPTTTIAYAHQSCPFQDPVTTMYMNPFQKISLSYGGRANWHAWSSGAPAYSVVRPVAVSGYIGPNEESVMIFRFTGIYFTFLWRTSSEPNKDVLSLYVDGETIPQAQISGETDWEIQQRDMAYGPHEVKIVYRKDATGRAGQDRGFVTDFLVDNLD